MTQEQFDRTGFHKSMHLRLSGGGGAYLPPIVGVDFSTGKIRYKVAGKSFHVHFSQVEVVNTIEVFLNGGLFMSAFDKMIKEEYPASKVSELKDRCQKAYKEYNNGRIDLGERNKWLKKITEESMELLKTQQPG